MAETKQEHVTGLKKGSYLIIDGIACVVRDIQTSKPGTWTCKMQDRSNWFN